MDRILVVTHIDSDGILSARLFQLYFGNNNVDVVFCDWRKYGVPDAVFETDFIEKYKHVYACDIALDLETVKKENAVSENLGLSFTHIDHHPHDMTFMSDKTILLPNEGSTLELSDDYTIVHALSNCATGLTFDYLDKFDLGDRFTDKIKKWSQIWALVGIYADVAAGTSGGKEIVSAIRKQRPDLLGKYKIGGITTILPKMVGRFLNNPRRIAFNNGPRVSLNACREIEDLGDFSVLFSEKHDVDARAPNAALLRRWNEVYTAEIDRFYAAKDFMIIDFVTHGFVVFEHEWNIGSSIASSISSRYKIPYSAINMGLSAIIVNGRSITRTSKTPDLGIIYKDAVENSEYGLQGGGHPKAAACAFKKEMTYLEVISVLQKSFIKFRSTK